MNKFEKMARDVSDEIELTEASMKSMKSGVPGSELNTILDNLQKVLDIQKSLLKKIR